MKTMLVICLLMLCGCSQKEMNTTSGMAYTKAHDGGVCVTSVYLENGRIQEVNIDELTFLSKQEYDGILEYPDETMNLHLASKLENNDRYSSMMTISNATQSFEDNLNAIKDYVIGKSVEELEDVDTIAGCTLTSAKGYLNAIIEACHKAN